MTELPVPTKGKRLSPFNCVNPPRLQATEQATVEGMSGSLFWPLDVRGGKKTY